MHSCPLGPAACMYPLRREQHRVKRIRIHIHVLLTIVDSKCSEMPTLLPPPLPHTQQSGFRLTEEENSQVGRQGSSDHCLVPSLSKQSPATLMCNLFTSLRRKRWSFMARKMKDNCIYANICTFT